MRLKLFLIAFVGLVVLGFAFHQTTRELFGVTRDARESLNAGDCRACHLGHDYVKNKTYHGVIPPARFHNERFRLYTHGREPGFAPHRCASCHEAKACRSCHETKPPSHVAGFVSARGGGEHALLGRIRPSSCLTCHQNFMTECTKCHTVSEAHDFTKMAEPEARKWFSLTR